MIGGAIVLALFVIRLILRVFLRAPDDPRLGCERNGDHDPQGTGGRGAGSYPAPKGCPWWRFYRDDNVCYHPVQYCRLFITGHPAGTDTGSTGSMRQSSENSEGTRDLQWSLSRIPGSNIFPIFFFYPMVIILNWIGE